MWQYESVLSPFSNREDYFQQLAVFDDDTLEPIDLSGIVLANPGNSFTASAWTVTDGSIVTTSSTQFTIPMFPVTSSNNLTALNLTVGTGLNILQGDPVSIKDTLTKSNIITGYVQSYTPGNGSLTVQIGWNFEFEIRQGGPRNSGAGDGYGAWWDWGVAGNVGPALRANFMNGYLSLTSNNVVQILIPASIVQTIGAECGHRGVHAPGTYRAALVGTDSINTRQFLLATQPFFAGGVRPNWDQNIPQSQAQWQAIF